MRVHRLYSGHGEAKLLIADREFAPIVSAALAELDHSPAFVEIDDGHGSERLGGLDYEAFVAEGDPAAEWQAPPDEWAPIALTTRRERPAIRRVSSTIIAARSERTRQRDHLRADRHSVYLWTLPMFHCNGWTYPWAVTAVAGTHICLRRVDPAAIFAAIADHRVTHLCGAPVVLNMLIHAPEEVRRRFDHVVEAATGGAAPPSAVIGAMERWASGSLTYMG